VKKLNKNVLNQLNCIEHRPMTIDQGTWVSSRTYQWCVT